MAKQHELVEIAHPDIDGTARVPRSALRHMDPRWQVVEASDGDGASKYLCPACLANPSQRPHQKCEPKPAVVVTEEITVAPKRAERKKEQ